MSSETQLRIPGPTPLPPRVVHAASRQMISHRGQDFAGLFAEIITGLKAVLRTENDVLVFPASGSGGLEAAVANLLSPSEPALFCSVGAFGDRWADIADAYGVAVVRLRMPDGEAVSAQDVDAILAQHPEITTVFVTHNETSTGVTNDLEPIAAVVKARGKLLAIDAVSSAACLPLETDALGLDVVVTCTQKGFMSPPGVTMIAVSPAAYAKAELATLPRWYFDFAREKSYQTKNQTLTTPALAVLYALQESMAMIREEGLENVWQRHARIGMMIRAGVEALGLRLLAAPDSRSNTVTAVLNPTESPEALKELLTRLRRDHNLVLTGGQNELLGKIFRIAHMGFITDDDVYAILNALEDGCAASGLMSSTGVAAAAARAVQQQSSVPA